MNIGKDIKNARLSCGIKQEILAKDLYLSKSYMSLIENDKRPITIDMFVEILKKFKEYGNISLIEKLLENIKNEVLGLNEFERVVEIMEKTNYIMENLFDKGFGKIKNLECATSVVMPNLFCRYEIYVVKDFKTKDNNEVCLFFIDNDLGSQIVLFKNSKTNNFISKIEFEEELKKEEENFIKYGGYENIPENELFSLETNIIFSNKLDNNEFISLFNEETYKTIVNEFNYFLELVKSK